MTTQTTHDGHAAALAEITTEYAAAVATLQRVHARLIALTAALLIRDDLTETQRWACGEFADARQGVPRA